MTQQRKAIERSWQRLIEFQLFHGAVLSREGPF